MDDNKLVKYNSEKATKVGDRVLRFIGSTQDIDRDNERIMAEGWLLKNYKKNPVVLVNHKYADLPVAKTKKVWVDGKKLMFDIEFPEPDVSSIGDTLYKLYKNGYMNATSVGFRPNMDKATFSSKARQPRITFNEQELLEISLVSVPANPQALMTSKSMKDAMDSEVIDELEYKELDEWVSEIYSTDYEKPYANEHACRLNDPGKYIRFRRKNGDQTVDGKKVDVIYGVKKDGKSEIQSLRFPIKSWTEAAARAVCKRREGIRFEPAKKKNDEFIESSMESYTETDINSNDDKDWKEFLDKLYQEVQDASAQDEEAQEEKSNECPNDDDYKKLFQILTGENE